jgi:hypothetical protein
MACIPRCRVNTYGTPGRAVFFRSVRQVAARPVSGTRRRAALVLPLSTNNHRSARFIRSHVRSQASPARKGGLNVAGCSDFRTELQKLCSVQNTGLKSGLWTPGLYLESFSWVPALVHYLRLFRTQDRFASLESKFTALLLIAKETQRTNTWERPKTVSVA